MYITNGIKLVDESTNDENIFVLYDGINPMPVEKFSNEDVAVAAWKVLRQQVQDAYTALRKQHDVLYDQANSDLRKQAFEYAKQGLKASIKPSQSSSPVPKT